MGMVSECIDQSDRGGQHDQNMAVDNRDRWERSDSVAWQTQAAVQQLQVSVMSCQATVDHSRAQVAASRALLDSLRERMIASHQA
jgi:hypothetical protein